MKIIISPAKKMNVGDGVFRARQLPCFLAETKELLEQIRRLTYEEAKKLWACSDKLAQLRCLGLRRGKSQNPFRLLRHPQAF